MTKSPLLVFLRGFLVMSPPNCFHHLLYLIVHLSIYLLSRSIDITTFIPPKFVTLLSMKLSFHFLHHALSFRICLEYGFLS